MNDLCMKITKRKFDLIFNADLHELNIIDNFRTKTVNV